MAPLLQGMVTILAGAFACLAWVWASDRLLDRLTRRGSSRAGLIRPWLFLMPALLGLGLYLVHPAAAAVLRSLHDRSGAGFVGLANYLELIAAAEFRTAFGNTLMWLLLVPAAATALGLVAAQLTDRLGWGGAARATLFMPMAISFVGAAVIWKFVYANDAGIGLLNALRAASGAAGPVDPLQIPVWNTLFLMAVMVWIKTGFAMVILAAALRGIPGETLEAARLDGAGPWRCFLEVQVPQIMGSIVAVWTVLTVLVLKVFDVVYTMTGGNFGTHVLPSYMMSLIFRDDGRATAVAVVILLLVLPAMGWTVARARREGR